MDRMTIGRVAARAGVGVETVRFYERKGLINRPRKPAGAAFRVYPADVVQRIRFVRRAQQLGFSLSEARELLELRANPTIDTATVRIRERAAAKLSDVEAKIRQLREVRDVLRRLVATCPGQRPLQRCSILDTLEQKG
ncbi:MAG: MerR family transcriptional regulator [Alphaproteobacteria bacterium]|nr:MerR family transcriptional regulator [Alphaproteobacteria bacterium]